MLALLVLHCAPLATANEESWRIADVDRIVAVGDVHGAYDALVRTLQNAGVIDKNLSWSGGTTHFVSTGDLLDRGAESRRVMDLVMRLEKEARAAGGRVHQLLGNHEVMNLIGDLRYVADEEYAAFADNESAEEREFWYERYRARVPADVNEADARAAFEKLAPPGYFGHRRAFRSDGKYGKWLLEKPVMVVINGTLFVHGGVPPFVREVGLQGVNVGLKGDLSEYVLTATQLVDTGVLSAVDRFKEMPALLEEKIESGELAASSVELAQRAIELTRSPLHGPEGPTWYRGTASCNALVEGDALDAALHSIGARRVVIGHTSTITRTVQQRMNGRVLEIDTGMLHEVYSGSGNALVVEEDNVSVVNQDGRTRLQPTPHPVRVGHESLAVTDRELEVFLEQGEILETVTTGPAWQLLRLSAADEELSALFAERAGNEAAFPDVAAYRLDRMLGLNMVPVTVQREIDGKRGALQFVPQSTVTERERVANNNMRGTPCPLGRQMEAMFVFDALLGNPGRTPSTMLYSTEDWNLMLIEHGSSFGRQAGDTARLQRAASFVGDEWRKALLGLTDNRLGTHLDGILTEEQLRELAMRRDELIRLSLAGRK